MGCDFSLTANAETGQIESLSIPQKEFYSAVPLRPASRTDVACKMNIETYDPLFGESGQRFLLSAGSYFLRKSQNLFLCSMAFLS